MVIYSMEVSAVDPVFFPVVPDSFTNRGSANRDGQIQKAIESGWKDEVDTPFLSPQDPWSF